MLQVPDAEQVERWLRQAGIHYYVCDQCHGLHLSELQGRDGVLDSRLFVEQDSLLLTTELELRPAMMLLVMADTARLNMTWSSLKVFVDVDDDTLPRLVACDLLLTGAGVHFDQFLDFLRINIDSTAQLLDECIQLDYLYSGDLPPPSGNQDALH